MTITWREGPVTSTGSDDGLVVAHDVVVPPYPYISRREAQVIASCVRLGGQKAAAHELKLSPSTVKTHLDHAYIRLGVGSMLDALVVLGWLVIPDDL